MPLVLRQTGILKWTDLVGDTRTNTFTTQANPAAVLGTFGALMAAMQDASVAGLMYAAMQPVLNVNETPVTGPYPSVRDALQLIFRSSAGTTGRLNIPAPIGALFLPGNEKPDFESPQLIAVVEAAYACLSDPYGNPFVKVVSGGRMRIAIPAANGG